jgi:transmembrane sensor
MTSSDQAGHEQTPSGEQGKMEDEAVQWLLLQRAGDMSADQWDEFTRWLEADPRHPDVFDALVEADEPLDTLDAESAAAALAAPQAANDNWIGRIVPWALATAAALVLAIFVFNPASEPQYTRLATAPGERQTIALSDAITMTLNGSSSVSLEEGTANVEVLSGEVAFAINSEEPSPLRVRVDDLVLTDYGTVFNVLLNDQRLRVAVGEGVVAINPDSDPVAIEAGQMAEKAIGDETITTTAIAPETVATWRVGRLEFDDTPAPEAVAQMQRSTGLEIVLSDNLAGARLTGSILVPESDEEAVGALADFIGGTVRQEDELWYIE